MLPEKLQVTLKLKKFSAFYGNWRFITTFKSVHYWSISESQMNESDTLLTCLFTVYLYSLKSLPLRFLTKISSTILISYNISNVWNETNYAKHFIFSFHIMQESKGNSLSLARTHAHTHTPINKYIYLHLFIYLFIYLLSFVVCFFLSVFYYMKWNKIKH